MPPPPPTPSPPSLHRFHRRRRRRRAPKKLPPFHILIALDNSRALRFTRPDMPDDVPAFSLTRPRYDMDTFGGRLRCAQLLQGRRAL